MSAGAAAAPHLAAVSPPASVAIAIRVGTFSSDCLDELEHDAARPVRLRNPVLDPPDIDRRSRTCSAGGTEGRAMRPEVAGLIAGATVTLSSVLFGLAAKDTNPWFVVWVVLSATIVVGLALSVAR